MTTPEITQPTTFGSGGSSAVPSTFAVGDLLYADTTSTLARLADVATGSVLVSGGVGVAPAWSATPSLTSLSLVSGSLSFSGNISGSGIYGTSGIKVKVTAGTLLDTTSSGTIAANYNNVFGGNTQTATSATTITNNYGSYFVAPTISTNVTATNNFALGADSLFTPTTATNVIGGNTGFGSTAVQSISVTTSAAPNTLALVNGARVAWAASNPSLPDLFLSRAGAASLQLGAADAAAPVAQTLGVQSVVAGTTNTAGAVTTIRGSAGTGTGVGGNIVFQYAPHGSTGTAQNAFATALTINGDTAAITAVASITTSGSYILGNGQSLATPTRGALTVGFTADGINLFTNNAATGFTRLIFGTNDTSGIALKKNGTVFNHRLGDDSADAAITAAAGTFTGILTIPGGANAALTSSSTFTSGAGAGAGTITNAPSAGNPTSWIKINDNGTTRYVPAW